jgi:hypothetical protein
MKREREEVEGVRVLGFPPYPLPFYTGLTTEGCGEPYWVELLG